MSQKYEEIRMIELQNRLAKTRRHQRAREAQDVDSAMMELRPEITELVTVLATAHLARHGEGATAESIAQNYIEILNRVNYQIIRDVLWSQSGFWYKLTTILKTEKTFSATSDATYPKDQSIVVEYDLDDVQKQVTQVIEIVKKELHNETR